MREESARERAPHAVGSHNGCELSPAPGKRSGKALSESVFIVFSAVHFAES